MEFSLRESRRGNLTLFSLPRVRMGYKAVITCALALLVGCGGGGGGGGDGGTGSSSGSSNANLSGLQISATELDQVFQVSQLEYTATVDYLIASTNVTATSEDSNAQVAVGTSAVDTGSVTGSVSLNEGLNTVSVLVRAEDGTAKTYTIEITRQSAADFAQQAYLKASNANAGDWLGVSLSLSGDTLAVGAWPEDSSGAEGDNSAFNAGAVYIFVRNAGLWAQEAYLKAPNAEAGDNFGLSVALSGNTVAIGAPGEDSSAAGGEADNTATNAGATYIFVRTGGNWTQEAFLKASNAGANDAFGWDVALVGDTLVVGAIEEDSSNGGGQADNSATDAGAAYVFTRNSGVWSQQAFLKANNSGSNDQFGGSVALSESGDTLAVGSVGEDSSPAAGGSDNSVSDAGAVYVFVRSGSAWTQQAMLKAPNAGFADRFGVAISLSEDSIAVGAPYEDGNAAGGLGDNSAPDSGAVYVFTRNTSNSWGAEAYLKADNLDAGDNFGFSVALSGDALVIGAFEEDSGDLSAGGESDNSASSAGAAYFFTRNVSTWDQSAYIKASNAEALDRFGRDVSLSGDTLAVSAFGESSSATGGEADNTTAGSGAVYTYQ